MKSARDASSAAIYINVNVKVTFNGKVYIQLDIADTANDGNESVPHQTHRRHGECYRPNMFLGLSR